MKQELEEALRNIDITCARASLVREEHMILARNIQLIKDSLEAKSKKKEK